MRRREFISFLAGGAFVLPLTARAQQKRMPIIGLLGSTSADESTRVLDALRAGLKESGFIEGQSITIEYRWRMANTVVYGHWQRIWSTGRQR
jgi:putative ABC transport system substrate-binding protein